MAGTGEPCRMQGFRSIAAPAKRHLRPGLRTERGLAAAFFVVVRVAHGGSVVRLSKEKRREILTGVDAEGTHEGDLTIIRGVDSGEGSFLALFFVAAALALAGSGVWHGNAATTVVGVALAVVILGVWIFLRRDPQPVLTIGPDEITKARRHERRRVVARDATGWLRIEWAGAEWGWQINALDGDENVGWVPLGTAFNADEVADACKAHGWPVWTGHGDPPERPQAARPQGLPPMSKPERIVVGVIIAIPFFVLIGALAVTALNRL